MTEPREQRALKILTSFFLLILVLIAVALFMQSTVTSSLNLTLEKSVARQAADISLMTEERFRRELAILQTASNLLAVSRDPSEEARTITSLRTMGTNVTVGLMSPTGKVLYGTLVSEKDFPRLVQAKSSGVTDYNAEKGLIFAVPVPGGRTLYRLYDNSVLIEQFGLPEVSAGSRLLIQDAAGNVAIPYKGYRTADQLLLSHPLIQNSIEKIHERLTSESAAAEYCDSEHGEFFICGARLPETNFTLVGYVPWASVGGDIAETYTLIIRTGSFLFLLLAGLSAYLLFRKSSPLTFENPIDLFPTGSRRRISRAKTAAPAGNDLLDVALGLNYSKGMEDLYWEMLDIFYGLTEETKKQLEEAFRKEDWEAYTTLVHSLRSSALSVGGRRLSEAAQALETAGHTLKRKDAEDTEKKAALAEIRTDHEALIRLYEETAEAAKETSDEHKASMEK